MEDVSPVSVTRRHEGQPAGDRSISATARPAEGEHLAVLLVLVLGSGLDRKRCRPDRFGTRVPRPGRRRKTGHDVAKIACPANTVADRSLLGRAAVAADV
ncbi:hypothetical protein ACIOMM_30940 [Streptomyces sp. NPDC087908]|uniref:hypothetical protein n=1 Tax=Streptomyces sp. NPDC087908 TaxID=3365820 RepID=UPI00380FFFE4